MPQLPQRTAPIAFRYGGIFGAILVAIGVGNALIQHIRAVSGPGASSLVLFSCVWFLATLGLLFTAGILAARENGRLAAGTWAGVIAAVIPTLALCVVVSVQALNSPSGRKYTHSSAAIIGYVIGLMLASALFLVLGGGLGAGLGVLGALIGRSRYRAANPQAYGAYGAGYGYPPVPPYAGMPPYPGMPPSPYPPYPPYPPAPPQPPYGGYPPAPGYAPSDTAAQGYGQAPTYPPPPPYGSGPSYPRYPRATSGAEWPPAPTNPGQDSWTSRG